LRQRRRRRYDGEGKAQRDMGSKKYSYELERQYYSREWPQQALPYLHLEPYLRCWLDMDQVFTAKRVLDIGAGECVYSRLIAERFGAGEVVACELFPERMLPAFRANQNLALRFVAGDCFRLPFEDRSFDVVFGSFILHHFPNLDKVASEIHRVLKSDGLYIGIEPNPWNPVVLYRQVFGQHASPNQYLLRPRHLALFADIGFSIRVTYFYAGLPRLRNRLLGTCMGILAELKYNETPKRRLISRRKEQ